MQPRAEEESARRPAPGRRSGSDHPGQEGRAPVPRMGRGPLVNKAPVGKVPRERSSPRIAAYHAEDEILTRHFHFPSARASRVRNPHRKVVHTNPSLRRADSRPILAKEPCGQLSSKPRTSPFPRPIITQPELCHWHHFFPCQTNSHSNVEVDARRPHGGASEIRKAD